jgi:hypothetical protein
MFVWWQHVAWKGKQSDVPITRAVLYRTYLRHGAVAHKRSFMHLVQTVWKAKKITALFSEAIRVRKKLSYPCNRPWRVIGLWDVEAPTFSRQSAHRERWGCQLYAPAALYPQEDSWYSFLLEVESNPGHSAAGRIRSIEKSNDLFGNRTRDLPACSIVPQSTVREGYV